MKLFWIGLLLVCTRVSAQHQQLLELEPAGPYDNIHSQKLYTDSLVTCFMIWVKDNVPSHIHAVHTEQVFVLSGKGIMTVDDDSFKIKKGELIMIPAGTPHSVTVTSRRPLKVLSVQSPEFHGVDRIPVQTQ